MKQRIMWMMIFVYWLQIGYGQAFHDLVISEVMADPSPQVGLPNQEYIEIHNRSKDTIDLFGIYLAAGNDTCRVKEHLLAEPSSYIILCKTSALAELRSFGRCLAVTAFPSIDNEEEILTILSADKRIIHALKYSSTLHSNAIKQKGGWSVEMSDHQRPCITENNFISSIDRSGGTPGRNNSIQQAIANTLRPLNAFMPDSLTLILRFSESVDSMTASKITSYRFSEPIEMKRIEVVPPLFNKVIIRLAKPVNSQVTLESILFSDCSGTPVQMNSLKASAVGIPSKGDLIINEIMFNPSSGGYDYVEIFNTANKSFDLRNILICSRSSTGSLQQSIALSIIEEAIYPGEYRVASTNDLDLQLNFGTSNQTICKVKDLPSMPDDGGIIVLTDEQGTILDEVQYRHEWHNPFIAEESGISLERLDPFGVSNDPKNWTSASSLVKGTPGKQNSQTLARTGQSGRITFDNKIISPDNDGIDDYLILRYNFNEPGMMGNIRIHNVHGYAIKDLLNNELLSTTGWIRWDGTDDGMQKCAPGLYIINGTFHANTGTVIKIREAITVAKRF